MKSIKTLGLLAVAAMALAALFGTASASAAKFTAGKVGATITEETKANHVFTVQGSTAECTEIGFAGSTEALESESQKVVPSYGGCTAFGFAATVTNSGCTYNLNANGNVAIEGGSCALKISVNNFFAKCEVVITAQLLAGASYANSGTGHITIKITIDAGISVHINVSSGLCPLTVGTFSNAASYTGESTIKAVGTTNGWDP